MNCSLLVYVSVTSILFISGCSNVVAQERAVDKKLYRVARSLKIGDQLRLGTTFGSLEGLLTDRVADTLWVSTDLAQRKIHLATVEDLSVNGRATRDGLLFGGAIGAFAGIAMVSTESNFVDDLFGNDQPPLIKILEGGLMGLFAGSALGSLVGSAIPKWHRKYHSRFRLTVLPNNDGGAHALLSISY